MVSNDEEDSPLIPPSADRVLHRAFCLGAIVCRSFIDQHPENEESTALNDRIRPWLVETGAESELEPWEAAALSQPFGKLDNQTRLNGTWLSEGVAALAWALCRYDLPAHDVSVDPQAVTNAVNFLQPDAAALLRNPSLRPATEIALGAERAFAVHWRLRQFSLTPEHMDFVDFARTAWFGPLNIEGVLLAESDLSVEGVPISSAPVDALRTISSIALERHKAFNWLLGYDEVYSEVDTST